MMLNIRLFSLQMVCQDQIEAEIDLLKDLCALGLRLDNIEDYRLLNVGIGSLMQVIMRHLAEFREALQVREGVLDTSNEVEDEDQTQEATQDVSQNGEWAQCENFLKFPIRTCK